jgi:hypothetical protein
MKSRSRKRAAVLTAVAFALVAPATADEAVRAAVEKRIQEASDLRLTLDPGPASILCMGTSDGSADREIG